MIEKTKRQYEPFMKNNDISQPLNSNLVKVTVIMISSIFLIDLKSWKKEMSNRKLKKRSWFKTKIKNFDFMIVKKDSGDVIEVGNLARDKCETT
ncbi:hypothetical protein [Enterococcus raffinosus]|uniref:hypothetical protein n=1 Tax=Enterococcus raffinosus TaxID=71452 RepID=UPI0028FD03B3|nr:hypothetical protein NUITMVRE36_00160 [Enterococcus raffinosus]